MKLHRAMNCGVKIKSFINTTSTYIKSLGRSPRGGLLHVIQKRHIHKQNTSTHLHNVLCANFAWIHFFDLYYQLGYVLRPWPKNSLWVGDSSQKIKLCANKLLSDSRTSRMQGGLIVIRVLTTKSFTNNGLKWSFSECNSFRTRRVVWRANLWY